ncbi:MAG: hypothetical protein IPI67_29015 [Myxococcales bacterium]|nr:hypothetical protein [Myxococcales bacterium]
MAARRDDSMLFSLNGLPRAEKERLARELREHRLAAEAALKRADERSRAKRAVEAERALEISEAERAAAQRKRQEELRSAAVRAAELERAEVTARARIEVLEKQYEHERRMLELRAEPRGLSSRIVLGGLLMATLFASGALGVYFGKLRPDTLRVKRAYDELVSVERARAEEAKRLLARSEARRATLAAELDVARRRVTELERAPAEPPPPAAKRRPGSGAAR